MFNRRLATCLLIACTCLTLVAQSYEKLWKEIEEAQQKDLPQTVINLSENVFSKAEKEQNTAQMLKAYFVRSESRRQISADSFYVDLKKMEEWVGSTNEQKDRAVLHTLLARIYSDCASQNLYALSRMSTLSDVPSDDIRSWSSKQFIDKILGHTTAALEQSESLFDVSTKEYVPFVIQHEASRYVHHNLYHLLAVNCADALLKVSRLSGAENDVKKSVYGIYRKLEAHYQQTGNLSGQVIVALDELCNPFNNLSDSLQLTALDRLIEKYNTSEVCAEVCLVKATLLERNGKSVDALQLCNETIERYSGYYRINAVKNLRTRITQPALMITTESVAYPGDSLKINVDHCNIDGFTIELYKANERLDERTLARLENEKLLKKHTRKVLTQHFDLIRPKDYRRIDSLMYINAPDEGYYVMRAVPDNTGAKVNLLLLSVSRLMMLSSSLPDNGVEAVVLDAKTGKPVSDATVKIYGVRDENEMPLLTSGITGDDGCVLFNGENKFRNIKAEKNGDIYMPLQYIYHYSFTNKDYLSAQTTVKLLTDRAIYRPGQTLYVKGVAYEQKGESANVLAGKLFTLRLLDANAKEIMKKELRSNEFGSFTTSFVLPSGSINGSYTLLTDSGKSSSTFMVEEYKRPTFEVVIDKPDHTYQPGDSITLKGVARTFSGVPMMNLNASYTVRMDYYGWGRAFWGNLQNEIVSDSVQLNDKGEFFIPVKLLDKKTDALKYGFYSYVVTATVTGASGETQSGDVSLPVGNRSLMLNVTFEDNEGLLCKEKPLTVMFTAQNLSSMPIEAKGQYAIYPFSGENLEKQPLPSVLKGEFIANRKVDCEEWKQLPSGKYTLILTADDNQGREVNYETSMVLFSMNDSRPPVESATWVYMDNDQFDATTPASFVFGTSMKEAYVWVDAFSGNHRIKKELLVLSDSLVRYTVPYKTEYGDGISMRFIFAQAGRTYQETVTLRKKMPDSALTLTWNSFRDKLRPGQQEEWILEVKKSNGAPVQAELLATMYDASLDKIYSRSSLNNFVRTYHHRIPSFFWSDYYVSSNRLFVDFRYKPLTVPQYLFDVFYPWENGNIRMIQNGMLFREDAGISYPSAKGMSVTSSQVEFSNGWGQDGIVGRLAVNADLAQDVTSSPRTNFNENAFFYPQLRTNEQGEVRISFTLPESLTRWSFNAYAHTKEMCMGTISEEVVAAKEFMLSPNIPRFVRVGDESAIAATVFNLSGEHLSGEVTFTLFDPLTEKVIATQKQPFTAEAGKQAAVNFAFTATGKYQMLGCRMMANSGKFGDGEQHLLPVLDNKQHVIETIPIPVRGEKSLTFDLQHLFNNGSKTATNRKLTVEFSGNSAWYAIQALPSLNVPESNNAIALASTYYANALAAYIMHSHPRIKTIIDVWQKQGGTKETFMSNLQKNQDVKAILLEETPWIMEASNEQERMQRIAALFDLNVTQYNAQAVLNRLKTLQRNSGGFTWFDGMPTSTSVTLYVATLFTRLQHLTGEPLDSDALDIYHKAFAYLHARNYEAYEKMWSESSGKTTQQTVSESTLNYLYLLALSDTTAPEKYNTGIAYYMKQLKSEGTPKELLRKVMKAVVLQHAGDKDEAGSLSASIKQYLTYDEKKGLFFDFSTPSSITWSNQPVPVHVAVMEGLNYLGETPEVIEEMKLWLLTQKQTQQWSSPVNTANAVYALLSGNGDYLTPNGDVHISIAGKQFNTLSATAIPGMAYLKESIDDPAVLSKHLKLKVSKREKGIAWGAVYAQYEEEISKVSASAEGLSVQKTLYVERIVNGRKELVPVTPGTTLNVGDRVVSRLTLTLDRQMDFVQLKDQRAACFEPESNLSGYRQGVSANYYMDVKDASTNFFFYSLNKGVYVLEHSQRMTRSGSYESGLTVMQSAYAPEYTSYAPSVKVLSAEF